MLGREARQTTRSTHETSALRRSRVGTRAWQRGGECPIRAEGDGMNSPATSTYLPPGSQLAPVTPKALEDPLFVRELTHRFAEVSKKVRDRMNRLGDADLASQ